MNNKPAVGERVSVTTWLGKLHTGTVQSLLSMQFTYIEDTTGRIFYCLYNGDWSSL